jgi:hypothetical protein
MTIKTAQARADKLNNLMVIIKSQSARIAAQSDQISVFLHQIKHAEMECKKTKEQQAIDRLECAEIARNWENNTNFSQAFRTKFMQDVQLNPTNQWARLLWFGLALAAQNNTVLLGADLQAARPTQTFEEMISAPPNDPIQIINLCFDYSPTVLYDLQLLISFYSSIINS